MPTCASGLGLGCVEQISSVTWCEEDGVILSSEQGGQQAVPRVEEQEALAPQQGHPQAPHHHHTL